MEPMCVVRRLILNSVLSKTHYLSRNYRAATLSNCRSFFSKENQADSTEQVTEESQEPNPELKKLQDENKALLEKVAEIDDKYKRALAEMENTRVRMLRQVEEAKIFGIQKFSKDLLEVADVLEKASSALPPDAIKSSEHLKNLFEGVTLTEQQLQTVFRRHGLTKINPIGSKFDPNEHHAMFEAEIPGKEPGTVAEVIKVGYKLKERTIRPAMVGVVKANN